MKNLFVAAFILAATAFDLQAGASDDGRLVKLQSVMQTHIDANSVNGALLRFDPISKQVTEMFATKAHPKIMKMGSHIVMCADFVDAQGKMLMGNFYIAQEGDRYVVFNTTWGEDAALMSLMKEGKLSMVN